MFNFRGGMTRLAGAVFGIPRYEASPAARADATVLAEFGDALRLPEHEQAAAMAAVAARHDAAMRRERIIER